MPLGSLDALQASAPGVGFGDGVFFSPTLMDHREGLKGLMLCAASSCHPASLLLISLETSPRCRLACQVGLANIRCEDWFVCKLGKDHQFLICISVLQALWSDDFFPGLL